MNFGVLVYEGTERETVVEALGEVFDVDVPVASRLVAKPANKELEIGSKVQLTDL